jgi:hypothetical protein
VSASCANGTPFVLAGYKTGDTLAEAEAATQTQVAPSFTDLTSSKFVIVANRTCPDMVHVTIDKFIDGAQATAVTGAASSFPMSASWNATSTGAGSGSFTLGPVGMNSANPYEAITADMTKGADYAVSEDTSGNDVVGASCADGKPYALAGYTRGGTLAAAAAKTPTTTAPTFTSFYHDKYVIVWNVTCNPSGGSTGGGDIGGDVTGGTSEHGTLAVSSIDSTDTSATADGTFANGWVYTFHVTVPDNETNLSMKFANWFNSVASSSIPVAGNMRISSAQADNGGATVLLTAANTYSSPALHMTGDLDAGTAGIQVDVTVEVAVPANTVNGSYTTSYGIQTLP